MSKNPNTRSKTPLLYIQQPALKETQANMQQRYSSRNAQPKPVEKKTAETAAETKPKRKKRSYFEDDLGSLYGEEPAKKVKHEEIAAEQDIKTEQKEDREPENRKRSFSFKPLKPFREMELDEKIVYLSGYSNGKAPFPCEFVTAEERYKGILLKIEGDALIIKSFQGDEIEVNRSSLKAIKIIGL
ncbi:CotO family spore coat protein [Bacillus sp. SCS-153A]|uniref:CotO family spore coat protein n=1 Tax=Rossellomorea sedimentorum TaxID=3115294 RepID=UPI003906B2C7